MSAQFRYDLGWCVPAVVVAYLQEKLSAAIQAVSPVITVHDPMASEEENRIIVEVRKFDNQPEAPGCFNGECVCTAKSRWAKPTVEADLGAHYDRFNWMCDCLMSPTIADDINALSEGFVIEYVQPRRNFSEDLREGWVYSELIFRFNGHFK